MTIKIALDAMGGDLAPSSVIKGVKTFLESPPASPDVFFNIYGNSSSLNSDIKLLLGVPDSCYKIIHAERVIPSDMKPSHALRYGRGASMFEAISSVLSGESDAVVSAGNTGAYMALSKALLKTIDGIERPALVSLMPTAAGSNNVVLDLGANAECSPLNLFQFALMGNAVAKALLHISHPTIGLLNVGTEKTKGTECVREAFQLISEHFENNFKGFVEGTDILQETVNVIVTDGFSGNIALKTIEGTFKFIAGLYKNSVKSSILGKISYLMSKPLLGQIWNIVDPRKHNGASLVGLNGIAVKSHGNADAFSFSSAISVAVKLAESNFVQNIKSLMEK